MTKVRTTSKLARRLALGLVLLTAGLLIPSTGHATPATFYVGVGERDISPNMSVAEIGSNNFFLGGYGFGSGRAGTQDQYVQAPTGDRHAVGVMGKKDDGSDLVPNNPFAPWVRAFAIGDGTHTIVLADFDNQGTFASYKPNSSTGALRPYAIDDIRAAAAAAAPGLDARSILLSSDHSHAGQDLTGVWGFVPDAYLVRVKQLAVEAIVEAYTSMQPAILKQSAIQTPQPCTSGTDTTRIFSNQFCGGSPLGLVDDHANDFVDSQVRVLRAFHPQDPDGSPFAVLVNAAIHATVGGSDNLYVSSDWVSTLSNYIERDTGAKTVTIVGDVGRTQPADRTCDTTNGATYREPLTGSLVPYDTDPRELPEPLKDRDSCAMSQYARRVQAWVDKAIAETETTIDVSGVDYRELFIRDASDSVILFGLNYGGDLAGLPITRGITPPYLSGAVLGTWVGAYRVGDVLMVSAPGEAYPNIRDGVIAAVQTSKPVWTFGLANDQLGYLIAPTPEGYPEPIRKSFFDGDPHDAATWGISPIDNDNFFFNVSPTIGDHVMCTMIKGALQLGFAATSDQPAKCAPWIAEVNESGPGDPTWKLPA